METIQNMSGQEITVRVIEGQEPNEYSLHLRFDGHCSMSTRGYKEGGDFSMFSMTPEAMVNLAWAIIEAAAKAKTTRDMGVVATLAGEV